MKQIHGESEIRLGLFIQRTVEHMSFSGCSLCSTCLVSGYGGSIVSQEFLQDFLYYIPYAVLSAMTIPAVFYATGDFPSAIAATVIAVVLAWNGLPLIVVALAASGTALLASLIEQWI